MSVKEKREEQLGMSYGKANNILKKSLIFHLVCSLNLNNCYRCSKEIENVSDFSIDHKIDWLDSEDPKELFFDIENIAFSHMECNLRASRNAINHSSLNRIGESGYKGVVINHDSKKARFKYKVHVHFKGKKVFAGYFNDPKKAALAYDKKSIELLGSKAITNKKLNLV